MNLSTLRRLDLGYNDLTTVPLVVGHLPKLRRLSLAYNPITSLANASLQGVADHLDALDIRGLAINYLDVSVLVFSVFYIYDLSWQEIIGIPV